MKRTIILLLVMLTTLTGCVSKGAYEDVQQDLSATEEVVSDQQSQIAELTSSLEQTSAELEEAQITLANTEVALADEQMITRDIRAQLVDTQEQIEAISETPFGLYYAIDTPDGQLLWSPSDDSDEILIDGYALIRNDEDIKFRPGVRDITLGHWVLMAVSAPGVEVDKHTLSGLVTGPDISPEHMAVGYQDILDQYSEYSADHYGSLMYVYIPCTWKSDLGWVSDYPIRVLKHPLIEYLVNDIHGHHEPLRFEILEPTMQFMTLALDPELIVQARESAAEVGVDFEVWLTEAILAKLQ